MSLKVFKIKSGGDDNQDGSGNQDGQNQDGNNSDGENNQDNNQDGSGSQNDGDNAGQDFASLPEWAQKQFKDLRTENAKHRTNNNNLSTRMEKFENGFKSMFGEQDADADPQVQLETMQGEYESVATQNAILSIALENGVVGAENVEYFQFLMDKSLNSLKEGEEMSQEQLGEILSKCSKGNNANANTSTNDGKKGGQGPDQKDGDVTQEDFDKMGILEKSALYRSKPDLYNKLFKGSL